MFTERKPMPICTPEAAGIPSKAIESYISALVRARLAMHDVLIAKDGKLCYEAYWKPMQKDFVHRLYSCSKSLVSMAVGLLIEQGRLSLEDECLSFFPDKAPKNPHPWLKEMTIRDLLRMATCYENGSDYKPSDPDWEETFFTGPISHKPGQVFNYCTSGTTMLCMIIKRVTGMEFMQVLRPVFDEIGVSEDAFCVHSPCGHEWGGSGVCVTPRDFMKIARLCTSFGEYEGVQLLPREYMRAATREQISLEIDRGSLDTASGYGYQFWPMREGFAMRGMGGQFALCLPEKNLTLITNAYDELCGGAMTTVFDAFFAELYPHVSTSPLPEDARAHASLMALTETLAIPVPPGEADSPMRQKIAGYTYHMSENRLGLVTLRFEFGEGEGILYYENATGEHALPFGLARQKSGVFPETHYFDRTIGVSANRGYSCLTSAAWSSENELALYCQIIDIHLGNLKICFAFDGNAVTLRARKHAEWFLNEYEGFASGEY